MRDEVLADADDQPRFCVARRSDTNRGARGASLAPAVYARFWIALAQSTGVPSGRRYLEPGPPLVRVFDYRLAGENHHHRTPSYDSPIVLGPLIGVYVDRLPKKFFLIGSNVFRAVLIGIIPCAVSTDTFTVNLLYVLVLLDAVAMATFSPALTSSVPLIVPRAQFTAANALIQSTTSLGIIFGPALSGIGIALFGSQEVLCLNAVTYCVAALCLGLVRLGTLQPSAGPKRTDGSVWHRSHGGAGLRRDQTTRHPAAGCHRGVLRIRRQRPDDVVSGLCEKAVGSGAGRGGLPLVRPGSGAAAHVDSRCCGSPSGTCRTAPGSSRGRAWRARWRSGCSSGRKTSTWSVCS